MSALLCFLIYTAESKLNYPRTNVRLPAVRHVCAGTDRAWDAHSQTRQSSTSRSLQRNIAHFMKWNKDWPCSAPSTYGVHLSPPFLSLLLLVALIFSCTHLNTGRKRNFYASVAPSADVHPFFLPKCRLKDLAALCTINTSPTYAVIFFVCSLRFSKPPNHVQPWPLKSLVSKGVNQREENRKSVTIYQKNKG